MRNKIAFTIWTHVIAIMVLGLLSVYSATYQNVRVDHSVFWDQLFCAFLGLGLMYFLSRFDYRKFYDAAYVIYFINVFLLVLVMVGGRHALGARRWLELGFLSFQPSEVMKFSLILMLGRYFSNRRPTLSFSFLNKSQMLVRDLFFPLIVTLIPAGLVFKQPDLGTSILLMGIFFSILFVTTIEWRYFLGFIITVICLIPFGWQHLKDYQKDRLLVFLNPNIDPLGAGYTIIQSKITIGSGQLFGKGWLAGTQNQLNFLPERHTDFIFSVVAEEWGLVGTLFLVYCYFMIICSAFRIAEQMKDRFGVFVTVGIGSILALQVVINIGMVMGLFPVVGITLPFVSYGRTSFMIFVLMIGFLLNLSKK